MKTINEIVKSGLCLGCGICTFDSDIGNTVFDINNQQFIPSLKQKISNLSTIMVCPGKGYDIINISNKLFDNDKYSVYLGRYDNIYLGRTLDQNILNNASSGGIVPQICFYLLRKGIVSNVITTKFIYTASGPVTKTILTSSKDEIILGQGSKYCPVDISMIIPDLLRIKEKCAFIGTPCQVAGIRILQEKFPNIKENISFMISNFCGGFKSYQNMKVLAKRNNISYNHINLFRFRGGTPSSLLIKDEFNNSVNIKYPDYVSTTGVEKHLRCRLCVDATGELSNISCGDARKDQNNKWSYIICRTKYSSKIIEEMTREKFITSNMVNPTEVVNSQIINIKSKKVRFKSKLLVYKCLGRAVPEFDGGYEDKYTSIYLEIKILLKSKIKKLLKRSGMFWMLIYNSKKKIC